MKIELSFEPKLSTTELNIFSCFNKTEDKKAGTKTESKKTLVHAHWPSEILEAFEHNVASKNFGMCK